MAKNTQEEQVFRLLSVKGKSIEKHWRPEVAIWRLKLSVRSPGGADVKNLISDPGQSITLHVQLYIHCNVIF